MSKESFWRWYLAHLKIRYDRLDSGNGGYIYRYENGDTYECRYALKPGYLAHPWKETMSSDYDCTCLINGQVISQNGKWEKERAAC